jgi:hypothetical protein
VDNGRAIFHRMIVVRARFSATGDNSSEEDFVPADDNGSADDTGNTDNANDTGNTDKYRRYRQHRQVPTIQAASPKTVPTIQAASPTIQNRSGIRGPDQSPSMPYCSLKAFRERYGYLPVVTDMRAK